MSKYKAKKDIARYNNKFQLCIYQIKEAAYASIPGQDRTGNYHYSILVDFLYKAARLLLSKVFLRERVDAFKI
jgi:hypothetical protein